MRKINSQKGITLVALIITIIVLLILAVVAIGAITNDGIISKAKQARDDYGKAQDKENSILQGYLDKINENSGNGNDGNSGNTGNDNQGNGNTENESTGNENNKEVYVNDYGAPIEYSVDLNDDGNLTNDWKVFYKDDTHWYIIASDYLPNRKLPTGLNMSTDNSYGTYWSSESNFTASKASDSITESRANKYKLNWFNDTTKDSINYNARATADLLNVEAWTTAFGNSEKGINAIGTPTLEMWVASWNAKEYTQLYTDSDEIGYFIGTSTTDLTSSYWADLSSDTTGFGDKLYFPHPYGNDEGWSDNNNCYAYWLASPSAHDSYSVLGVNYDGGVYNSFYYYYGFAARPLVSVPSNLITLNTDGSFKVEV